MGFLSGFTNAIKSVGNAIVDTVSDVADTVGDAVSTVAKGAVDLVDDLDWSDISNAFNSVLNGSLAEKLCDKFGLPEWVGDIAGIVTNINPATILSNRLDLLANVAEACGFDNVAGYLEIAGQGLDIGVQIATSVALTAVTGGAAGVAAGAQVVSAISTIAKGIETVQAGIDTVEAIQSGDWKGAAMAGMNLVAGVADVGGALGASKEVLGIVDTVAQHGETVVKILEDGKITADDLKHVASSKLVKDLGLDLPPDLVKAGTVLVDVLRDGKIDASDLGRLPLGELAERTGLAELANSPHAKAFMDFVQGPVAKALQDGKLDASDLSHLPVADLLAKAGLPADLSSYGSTIAKALEDGRLDASDLQKFCAAELPGRLGLDDLYTKLPESMVDAMKTALHGGSSEGFFAQISESFLSCATKQALGCAAYDQLDAQVKVLEKLSTTMDEAKKQELINQLPEFISKIDVLLDLEELAKNSRINFPGIPITSLTTDYFLKKMEAAVEAMKSKGIHDCVLTRDLIRQRQQICMIGFKSPHTLSALDQALTQVTMPEKRARDLISERDFWNIAL